MPGYGLTGKSLAGELKSHYEVLTCPWELLPKKIRDQAAGEREENPIHIMIKIMREAHLRAGGKYAARAGDRGDVRGDSQGQRESHAGSGDEREPRVAEV